MCLLIKFMRFTAKVQLISWKKLTVCQVCNVLITPPGLEISSLEDIHTHINIVKVDHVRRDIIFYHTYTISWRKL